LIYFTTITKHLLTEAMYKSFSLALMLGFVWSH